MKRLALMLTALCCAPALAQTAPDAGQILRETQPVEPLPPVRELDVQLPAPETPPSAPAEDGPSVPVKGFSIGGNSAIASAELLALLEDLHGKELTLSELEAAAARITKHYRDLGYPLARAYVPAQTVSDGVIRLEVLEGRYGEIEVDNKSNLNKFAQAPLENLHKGEAVRADALERSLLLMNERAGAKARAILKPGAEIGETDLLVALDKSPFVNGAISYDNGGNRYTGAHRLTGMLSLNSPTGLGDQLNLVALGSSEKQQYYMLSYLVPLGRWGTSVGLSQSYMRYELGKDFKYLDNYGTARTTGVVVNHPIVASRILWVAAHLRYDHKRLEDHYGLFKGLPGAESDKTSKVTTVTVDGNARDTLWGGGISQFSLAWLLGDLSLDSYSRSNDELTTRTDGRFNVVRATVARLQRVTDKVSVFARLRAQFADGNLDGSEDFGLGGSDGVRGYPQGEAQGDEGWLATLEARYAVAAAWQASVFYDAGAIRVNKKRWAGFSGDNREERSSAGFGVAFQQGQWRAQAAVAWRLDGKPESDRDRKPRLWFQASWLF
jgi:hemolysin activation/secretion protein